MAYFKNVLLCGRVKVYIEFTTINDMVMVLEKKMTTEKNDKTKSIQQQLEDLMKKGIKDGTVQYIGPYYSPSQHDISSTQKEDRSSEESSNLEYKIRTQLTPLERARFAFHSVIGLALTIQTVPLAINMWQNYATNIKEHPEQQIMYTVGPLLSTSASVCAIALTLVSIGRLAIDSYYRKKEN